jgi:ATP-dependent DNA helicase RecQ
VIFPDTTLREIARERPGSLHALAAIPGVGAYKLEAYGPALTELVSAGASDG